MRHKINSPGAHSPRFYTVSQVAALFGVSPMTIYREIDAGQFPAVRIRGRLIVPAKAIDEMESAALAEQSVVAASDFVGEGVA